MLTRTRWQALAVLAAGAILGYGAATGRLGWTPSAHAAPQDREEVILFDILVPADAVVELGGVKTTPTGPIRHFQTPPLKVDGDYTYSVKATHDGKVVTRDLHLRHGATNALDLRAEFPAAAPVRTPVAAKPVPRAGAPGSPRPAERPKGDTQDEMAIQKNAEAFVAAFHKGDAKALAAFWTPDGDYTDLTGRHLKGRETIEKAFQGLFSEHKGLKVRIEGLALRFVTPDVAIEEGTSEVFSPDGGPPSRARYTNVHVKKGGQWLLSSVRDSVVTPPSNYEHLRGLGWAIGDWVGQAEKGAVERISLAWAANQNFIVGSFSTTFKSTSLGSAKQWIGWDPSTQRIRSWTFDDSGAFGDGAWTWDGDRWTIKTSSVLQDGKKATATLIVAPVDADTITFQSKDRRVDGKPLPDTKEVKMKRVK